MPAKKKEFDDCNGAFCYVYVNILRPIYTNSKNSTENHVVKFITQCQDCSCFETDYIFSYVQSRSYRAPEVIFWRGTLRWGLLSLINKCEWKFTVVLESMKKLRSFFSGSSEIMGNCFDKNHGLVKPQQNGQTRSVEGGTHQDPPSYSSQTRSQTPEKPSSEMNQPPSWRTAAPPGSSPKAAKSNSILENAYEDVKLFYTLGKELGQGQFGVTYLCTENSMGKKYACKSISKKKLVTKADKDDMRREIQIMQHLSGQPNIVEFKGAYEDEKAVNLVMELCAGGELFDRIIAKGHYSERAAASVCRQIVNVVKICHFMGVLHRDLKPENFLLSSKDDKALIKATDFGLSVFIEEAKAYRDIVGSAYYVAPEVLRRRYGKEVDIWSAGIILYILLSGVPPFWAGNAIYIIENI